MKPIKWILLVAFAGLIFPQLAAAETISQTVVIDWQKTAWTETACVDQFDPNLGTLEKVTIEIESCGLVNYSLESEDAMPQCFLIYPYGNTRTTLPNGDMVQIDLFDLQEELCVEADSDGEPDFTGNYSGNYIIEDCGTAPVLIYTDDSNLAEFIGMSEACFTTNARFELTIIGGTEWTARIDSQMMQTITVTYEYQPPLCISGHKFNDLTDEGLADWTINLKDANGNMIQTTTTGTGGYYEFCNLVPGSYTVCEVMKPGWTNVAPTCVPVELMDENVEDIDFRGKPLKNIPCGGGCPWFIKNELYRAQCGVIKEVPASSGILANDPDDTTVINPELIKIDPKYGTLIVEEDGSFMYDPSPEIKSGTYVIFKYGANNGICDARYLGIAKIQVSCKRS